MSQEFTLFEQRLMEAGYKRETINQILEVAKNSIYPKKYGLVWEEKEEKIKEDLKLNLPYFKENKDRELKLGELNSPQHLLIEGDNYESLKLLQTTHRGKVNVIYIDPPYNRGLNDFRYNDDYIQKDDEWRHSYWLSFIHKRLILAKELMSEDGVIFISIDDNEVAQLKLLCDEIFGWQNALGFISVINNLKGRSDDKFFATSNEFLLAYAKNEKYFNLLQFPLEEEKVREYKFSDEIGQYKEVSLKKTGKNSKREDRPNLYYPIYFNEKLKTFSLQKTTLEDIEILPKDEFGKDGCWRWGKDTFISKKDTELVAKKTRNGWSIYVKMRLIVNGESRKTRPKTTWINPLYDSSNGTKMIKELFGDKVFDNPKPIEFIKDILRIAYTENATVLDFFTGSGTTGHAVLELNKEDGGSRQFILCTNNENNICEEVTYERLKRVISGYTTPKGKEVEGIPANLKYLKVEMVEKDTCTEEDLSYLYMPHVLPLLQLKHNAFTLVAQSEGAVVYEKEGFRFGVASDLAVNSDFELLSKHLKEFEGGKVLYLFSTDTHSYPKYQQLAELDRIIQPIPREILNLLKGE